MDTITQADNLFKVIGEILAIKRTDDQTELRSDLQEENTSTKDQMNKYVSEITLQIAIERRTNQERIIRESRSSDRDILGISRGANCRFHVDHEANSKEKQSLV